MREGPFLWGLLALAAYGLASAVSHVVELIGRVRPAGEPVAYVVLVRDQADRIEAVLDRIAREVDGELVLVDLGSSDESAAILTRLARRYGNALVLESGHLTRREAVARAVAAAQASKVVLLDLDAGLEKEG